MSIDLYPKQLKRLERALKLEEGILAPVLESIDELEDKLEDLTSKPEIKGDKGEDGREGIDGKNGKDGQDGRDGKDGKDGKDGSDGLNGLNGVDGKDGIDGKDGSPDTAEQIVDKINTLPEEPDKQIDIKHIKGWKKLIEEMIGKSKTVFVGGAGTGGGRIVKVYDFSDQLNGVLKTFTLPAFWRIIDVQIGTIPPLRPTVDYTANAGNMTITFTDEIPAETYLIAGQSAICIYSE